MPDRLSILCVHGIGHGDVRSPADAVLARRHHRRPPALDARPSGRPSTFSSTTTCSSRARSTRSTYAEAVAKLLGERDRPRHRRPPAGQPRALGHPRPAPVDDGDDRPVGDRGRACGSRAPRAGAQGRRGQAARHRLRPQPRARSSATTRSSGTPAPSRVPPSSPSARRSATRSSAIASPGASNRWTRACGTTSTIRDDHVFTAELRIQAPNFAEIETPFDKPNDVLNHDPVWYFNHANTLNRVWFDLSGARPARTLSRDLTDDSRPSEDAASGARSSSASTRTRTRRTASRGASTTCSS